MIATRRLETATLCSSSLVDKALMEAPLARFYAAISTRERVAKGLVRDLLGCLKAAIAEPTRMHNGLECALRLARTTKRMLYSGWLNYLPREQTFQRRTYYRFRNVDERRAPTAPWLGIAASSLRAVPSSASVSTVDSAGSGYGFGYACYRVDEEQQYGVSARRKVWEEYSDGEMQTEIVRVRDLMFEIGKDGRIRRQR